MRQVSAALRIRDASTNRAVCSISGVNPNASAAALKQVVQAVAKLYNRGPVVARIHSIVELEQDDDPG